MLRPQACSCSIPRGSWPGQSDLQPESEQRYVRRGGSRLTGGIEAGRQLGLVMALGTHALGHACNGVKQAATTWQQASNTSKHAMQADSSHVAKGIKVGQAQALAVTVRKVWYRGGDGTGGSTTR